MNELVEFNNIEYILDAINNYNKNSEFNVEDFDLLFHWVIDGNNHILIRDNYENFEENIFKSFKDAYKEYGEKILSNFNISLVIIFLSMDNYSDKYVRKIYSFLEKNNEIGYIKETIKSVVGYMKCYSNKNFNITNNFNIISKYINYFDFKEKVIILNSALKIYQVNKYHKDEINVLIKHIKRVGIFNICDSYEDLFSGLNCIKDSELNSDYKSEDKYNHIKNLIDLSNGDFLFYNKTIYSIDWIWTYNNSNIYNDLLNNYMNEELIDIDYLVKNISKNYVYKEYSILHGILLKKMNYDLTSINDFSLINFIFLYSCFDYKKIKINKISIQEETSFDVVKYIIAKDGIGIIGFANILCNLEFENKKYYVDKLNILYSDEISYFLRECIENNDSFRFDIFNSNGFKS